MTKYSNITSFLFVVLICLVFVNQVCLAGSRNGNLEYWQKEVVSVDINKDFTFTAAQELRFGRHHGNPYFHNIDLGVVYKGFADWVDIGFNFKKEYEQDNNRRFRHENRPHLNLTLKTKIWDLDYSNRSRLEWRDRENKEEVWRYRNLSTVKFPVKLTKYNLQPYVAEEFFINLPEDNINQNRLSSGFAYTLTENIKGSIFYMLKKDKGASGWTDTNVIGLQFKFLF